MSERWTTRIGLILALAGNAIGLGNFLRFPVQAVKNGGGAFMIPYFLSLILLGIPLMWLECSLGRFGGKYGHHTTPGMFDKVWDNQISKYIGVLGIFIPFTILIYYSYITSWTLAFSFFSVTGKYFGAQTREAMGAFLAGFQGKQANHYFTNLFPAYTFFILTLALTIFILSRGVARGIEILCTIGIPLLFILGIVLAIRVLTFGTPDPNHPDWNPGQGLAYIWNPNFRALTSSSIWLAAAGQIFFTMSVGWGIIHTYTSYLKEKDDVALTGLATAATNEFAEVILGGTIAIPAAVTFFGLMESQNIAQGGAFDLGFQTMPIIFQRIFWGKFFGTIWFLLLFLAGLTSAVALGQTVIAFLQDELDIPRAKAAWILGLSIFILAQPVILFIDKGFLDEIDFWVGTLALVLFAFLEIIVYVWIFGIEKVSKEIERGALIRVPPIFYYILKYITPVFLIGILVFWIVQDVPNKIFMVGVDPAAHTYLWLARIMLLGIFFVLLWLVRMAWRRPLLGKR
jgi:SNF family Na+-dependent transporter